LAVLALVGTLNPVIVKLTGAVNQYPRTMALYGALYAGNGIMVCA
jgi:hypothetical protein